MTDRRERTHDQSEYHDKEFAKNSQQTISSQNHNIFLVCRPCYENVETVQGYDNALM